MLGVITAESAGSIRLHEKLGFRVVGNYEAVGFKFDSGRCRGCPHSCGHNPAQHVRHRHVSCGDLLAYAGDEMLP